MAIWGIFGGLGSGKTTTALFFLKMWHSQGKEIISNVHLNIPHIYMNTDEIFHTGVYATEFFKDKVLFIDEIHLLLESRRSTASVNLDFAHNIIIQLGKLDCSCIYTSQLLSAVDLRLREMTKYFIWCSKVDIAGNPIDSDTRITDQDVYIDLNVLIVYSDIKTDSFKATINPKELFSLFNTREIIKFDRSQYLKK